ncbi:hypothetical protein Xenpb_01941 [Xenorhabdus sp. PB62.4]|nr:hypothetical protein [Xenorhabdus sp. PB62.4]
MLLLSTYMKSQHDVGMFIWKLNEEKIKTQDSDITALRFLLNCLCLFFDDSITSFYLYRIRNSR